ncbi:TPA: oligosaccharide flippase family protein [Vibrio parahaemolyticus]|nr:oligosaccharide flippase family protein [Vibrio parahaemolyticus]
MKSQTPRNLLANILSLLANVITGILLLPYLVEKLGVSAYGLIPLSMIATEYIGIIAQSLQASINKYLTVAIKNDAVDEVDKVFSTSIYGMFVLVIMQTLVFIYPSLHIEKYIQVEHSFVNDARWLFTLTLLGFSLSLIASVFGVSMYANNRLDKLQVMSLIRVMTRVAIIVVLFSYDEVSLKNVGIATFLSCALALIYSVYQHKLTMPNVSFSIINFDFKLAKKLYGLGVWLIVNQVGFLLLSRVDLILVNKLFGPHSAGEYAIGSQFSNLLRTVLGVFSGLMGPIIMGLYAQSKYEEMRMTVSDAVKVLTVITACAISFLTVYVNEIIAIWLGKSMTELSYLVYILTIPLIFNIGILPLFTINTLYERVRLPGMLNIALGVTSIAIVIIAQKLYSVDYTLIAWVSVVTLSIKNAIFTPIYAANIMKLKWYYFIKYQILAIMCFFLFYFTLIFLKVDFSNMSSTLEYVKALLSILIIPMLSYIICTKNSLMNLIKR